MKEHPGKAYRQVRTMSSNPFKIGRSAVELFLLLKDMKVRRTFLFISISMSFVAALFAATEVGLMIPLLRGIIHNDFNFIHGLPAFGRITSLFPETFQSMRSLFLLVVAALFAASVMNNLFQYVSNLSIQYQVRSANLNIRKSVFDRYLLFGKLFFDRNGIGNLNTVLMNYTSSISRQLKAVQKLLGQIFALAAYTLMILFISVKLTVITFMVFPVMNFLCMILTRKIRAISKKHVILRKALDHKIFNILTCIPLVKANAMEEEEKTYFADVSEKEAAEAFNMERLSQLVQPLQNITTLVALLVVAFSLNMVISGPNAHSTSTYLVFFFLVRRMVPSFNALSKFGLSLATASGAMTPVLEILNDDSDKCIVPDGAKTLKGFQSSIQFDHLNFSYYPDVPVLKNVTFEIEKGKTTAIVGTTGSGKTTILSLLLRFYDCPAGSIFVDGEDIRSFTLESLRHHISFVSQDTLLFNDTLRANIIYGCRKRCSDDVLNEVLIKSRLAEFVCELPRGLSTIIGERGIQLSGGEKQRVSIARALLKGSEILIFDEATSSLDSTTETLIQDAIDAAIEFKTAIIIAHRLSTIRHADKIITLDKGRVVEEGPLAALVKLKGKFAELWEAQKFH